MPRCPSCYRRLPRGASCPEDGGSTEAMEDAAAGAAAPNVAGFKLGALLGAGGFAGVWSARCLETGAAVAIKVAHAGGSPTSASIEREAAALAELGAPHTPAYLDHGRARDGRPYVVMERLHGNTLAQMLEKAPRAPTLAWICDTACALLSALSAVHQRGWIHRDLKPENLWLDSGTVRLLDFGLAIPPDPRPGQPLPGAGMVVGTRHYMAPEQLAGFACEPRTDLYAFGAILYELITLRPPFVGDAATVEHGHAALRPPRPSQLVAVPEAVEELVLACLAKDPDGRPASADAARAALRRAKRQAGGQPSGHRTPPPSLLGGRPHLAAVLVADSRAGPEAVAQDASAGGGFIARHWGERYVCLFTDTAARDPARAAHAVAVALCEQSGRAALHLARLTIRPGRRGIPVASGRAIDVLDWLPSEPWRGLVVTDRFKRAAPDLCRPGESPGQEGEPGLPTVSEPPFVGRDQVIELARHSIRACRASAMPALFTAIGEPGLGKSRLARELASIARQELCQQVENVTVAPGSAASEHVEAALARTRSQQLRGLIIDNAHRLDGRTLRAIERATMDRAGNRLWVAVIADSELDVIRPGWGGSTHRFDRCELGPLTGADARAMAAALLRPAEYIAASFLDRIARSTGGRPQLMVALADELKRRGAIRRHSRGVGWDFIPDVLDEVPATASSWLVARDLDRMSAELAAAARVCAVLGASLHRDELRDVIDAAEWAGAPSTSMDCDMALSALVGRGVLEPLRDSWYSFRHDLYRASLYDLIEPVDRRRLHEYAAVHWRQRFQAGASTRMEGEKLAQHLERAGRGGEAAVLYLELGDRARSFHDDADAKRHYSAALRCSHDAMLRSRAFAGRGAVRARLHRTDEALTDLRAARVLTAELGDLRTTARLLLQEATAADSAAEYGPADEAARAAAGLVTTLGDPDLIARSGVARGRSAWRRGRADQAVRDLSDAVTVARSCGDVEAEIDGLVLLAPALVQVGRLDDAEKAFDDALALSRRSGDRLHECACYGNRLYLWSALRRIDRGIADLRAAIGIAREVGNPEPERVATHNLAELLHWAGELDEALALARRARILQERFWKRVPHDALLLARIHAARGELAEVRAQVSWIRDNCDLTDFEPAAALLLQAVELYISSEIDDSHWDELVRLAEQELPAEERIEIWMLRADRDQRSGRAHQHRASLERALELTTEAPVWKRRVNTASEALSIPSRPAEIRHPAETRRATGE